LLLILINFDEDNPLTFAGFGWLRLASAGFGWLRQR
jgi:hypothetical protein